MSPLSAGNAGFPSPGQAKGYRRRNAAGSPYRALGTEENTSVTVTAVMCFRQVNIRLEKAEAVLSVLFYQS